LPIPTTSSSGTVIHAIWDGRQRTLAAGRSSERQ